ncbi:MAG: redox-sensing transcriptional repressor Rex [Actinobacteria bacterium RBG_16_68_21]|nr:MAG: redox-sensing transcriptional repressor Rex [Actinobacteria bacterium RBG_16_68_21]
MKPAVPKVTVQRLPVYLRCLESLPPGQSRVSSDELAALAGVTSAKVRKDLSYLGSYGVRGVGYEVEHLKFQIGLELGLERDWSVVIVGIGNLGSALASYAGFIERRFRIVGLFDRDPRKYGMQVGDLIVEPMERLRAVVVEREALIGMITTPASAAQSVAQELADAGIRSILNFAPGVIQSPEGVDLRRVDLSTELQVLSFYLRRNGG